jgi:branched-chain amino acid aminotransferase
MSTLKIWMNGELVPEPEAKLPINSAAVFYATNCFEGLRAYWSAADEEMYCFRLADHFARLRESMKMMSFSVPYTDAQLYEAVRRVLTGNDLREDIHMHLVAYVAGRASTPPSRPVSTSTRAGGRVNENGHALLHHLVVRTSDNAIPIRLKSGSNYQNGRLATLQAKADGYDGPIFLNGQGHVAEGSGATFFMVRRGRLVTPPRTADILRVDHAHDDHPGPGASRSARTWWSARSIAPRSTSPTRPSSAGAATRSRRSYRSTASRSATAAWAR